MTPPIQDKARLPQAESMGGSPKRIPLTSKWSPEDIEHFVDATKLCHVCQMIFGPRHLCKEIPWDDIFKFGSEETKGFKYPRYLHHTSHRSLLHSLNSGCDLCIMVHRQCIENNTKFTGLRLSAWEIDCNETSASLIIAVWNMEDMYPYCAGFTIESCKNILAPCFPRVSSFASCIFFGRCRIDVTTNSLRSPALHRAMLGESFACSRMAESLSKRDRARTLRNVSKTVSTDAHAASSPRSNDARSGADY